MAAAAVPPDGGHGHCPDHSGVVAVQANHGRDINQLRSDLSNHCNGGGNHPSRREVDDLAEQVHENCKRIDQQREAKLAWWDKIQLAAITTVIATIIGIATAYIK